MDFLQNVDFIDVPVYASKFKVLCHAEAERVVKEAEAWLRLHVLQSGYEDKDGKVEKVIASKIALLGCQFFPSSPDSKVTLTLLKVMLWFFIFDDLMDEPTMLGANHVASQQFCGFILQAFFCMKSSEALAGISLLPTSISPLVPTLVITLLIDWWTELRVGMSTRQQARFCSHFSDYVLVHAEQAMFKQEKKVPDLDEYTRIRMVGGAIYIVLMLAEKDSGIELDEEDLQNPSIKKLNEVIGKHAGLLNDYVGLAHEYDNGDFFNMLTVLHYHNNMNLSKGCEFVPFQKACIEAWEIIRALEDECVASAKAVQEWARISNKPSLLIYVADLCSISAANWKFTAHSSRFTISNRHLLPPTNVNGVTFVRIQLTPPLKD